MSDTDNNNNSEGNKSSAKRRTTTNVRKISSLITAAILLVSAMGTASILAVVPSLTYKAFAVTPTITWTGAGGDTLWSNTANWSPTRLPTSTDQIEIPGTHDVKLDVSFTLDSSGTLTIDEGVAFTITSTLTNSGTITIDNSGPSGAFVNDNTINNKAGATITNAGLINNYGTISNSGTIDNIGNLSGGQIFNKESATITNSGTIINEVAGSISNDGTITNSGTITNNALATIDNGDTITNHGIINNKADGTIDNGRTITSDGTITNDGTIKNFLVTGGGAILGGTITNNAGGTITNNARGTIDNTNGGTIINKCGATFTNNGTFTGNPVQNEPCPDTTNPTIAITSPSDGDNLNTKQFQVKGTSSDNAGGTGVQSVTVQIDGGSPHTATPKSTGDWSTWSITTPSLSDGSHTIVATTTDGAGNQGTATIKVTIDTAQPDTKIISAKDGKGNTIPKSGTTHSSKITFTFTGTDNSGGTGVAGFQCSIDASNDFSSCTSPKTYTGLTVGTHTFYVRSLDKAGNADPTPATFKWKINGPIV